ncbi:MAG: hypothetical protein ACK5QC_00680 [Bacteroidota bacterium]
MEEVYVVFISDYNTRASKIGIDLFVCATLDKAISVAELPNITEERKAFINQAIALNREYFELVNNKIRKIRLEDVLI